MRISNLFEKVSAGANSIAPEPAGITAIMVDMGVQSGDASLALAGMAIASGLVAAAYNMGKDLITAPEQKTAPKP